MQTRLALTLTLTLGPGCLDARSGAVSTSDAAPADGASDATPADATPTDSAADATPAPDASALAGTPLGAWTHETIGDCIHVIERLEFDPTATVASWLEQDRNFCSNPQTDVTHLAVASVPDEHVVELAFGADPSWPSFVRWTWAVLPAPPNDLDRLTTAAFRRVPGTDRWRRDDQEIRGLGDQRYDRHLVFEVTLEGFPDVTAMVVDVDVRWTFASPTHVDRHGVGRLRYAAARTVAADGRTAFVADGYDASGYPDRYRFEQSLANQFDGYAIDLIAGAFYPVLYAADDGADSLYLDLPERVWSEAHP